MDDYFIIIMFRICKFIGLGRRLMGVRVHAPYWFATNQFEENKWQVPVNVQDFLSKMAIDYRVSGGGFRVKECAFCTKPHYNDQTNLYTLYVNKNNGVYYCHRCASKGSFKSLKSRYLNTESTDIHTMLTGYPPTDTMPISDTQYFFYLQNLHKPQYLPLLQYLKECGFKMQTIEKFQVGAGTEMFLNQVGAKNYVDCLTFPVFQGARKNVGKGVEEQISQKNVQASLVKFKAKGIEEEEKYSRFHPISNKTGFFGLNTISKNDRIVVITEGELNAMAIHQETGYPCLSLPQSANIFPDQLLPSLEQFEKIVIWFDNDAAGLIAEDKISTKLGTSRTYVARNDYPELKDAKQFLKKIPEKMKTIIERSKTKPSEYILDFEDIRETVKNRIFRQEDYIGIQVDWFSFFNKKVKGIRMKELTVISGPTGCGKTTLLSQITLDLCKKDIPVLWGSFEIKNEVLITNMMFQFSQLDLFKNQESFPHFSEKFKNLPLYFLNFQGSNEVERVMASIQYSIEKNNISVVVLDTLQFLLAEQAEGYQKFDLQDKVLSRLRRMATDMNVHIFVVIHPRKTDDNEDIQIHSIYGTSKAAQEADNVWMIQNRDNFRIFDIKKNRFDGDMGKVALGYNKNNKSFFQLKKTELSQLFSGQMTIDKIVQKRQQILHTSGPNDPNLQDQDESNSQEQLTNFSKRK